MSPTTLNTVTEDADREYQKKGGMPLAEILKQLKKERKERRGRARR